MRRASVCIRRFSFAATPGVLPTPSRTEEGIWICEGNPYQGSLHLAWGSILWDAGKALAKFFFWNESQLRLGTAAPAPTVRSRTVLELGAGTGVAGITLGKFGASVTMTDFEPEVLHVLRRNVELNNLSSTAIVRELSWAQPSTYMKPTERFDIVIAADVLYNRNCRVFMRALEAHMRGGMVAYIASPPRADSPLTAFLGRMLFLDVGLERLEDCCGRAVGWPQGIASDMYADCRFAALSAERCQTVAADITGDAVQIFRLTWPQEHS